MSKYIYQKFLLNCNYEDININDFPVFEGDVKCFYKKEPLCGSLISYSCRR